MTWRSWPESDYGEMVEVPPPRRCGGEGGFYFNGSPIGDPQCDEWDECLGCEDCV